MKQALMLMLENGTDRVSLAGGGAVGLGDVLGAA
jgi:hypothetical protein